jgi:hypothetical protein
MVDVVETVENVESSIPVKEQDDVIYTINDLLLDRTKKIPDEPLVGYPASTRGAGDYVYYTAKDLDRFADGALENLTKQGLPAYVGSILLDG